MQLRGSSVIVTGGASGLGYATSARFAHAGAHVVIVDLPSSPGEQVARELGENVRFVTADVTDEASVANALGEAEKCGPLRALVHCAGRGARLRVLDRDGVPGSLDGYEEIIRLNLVGSFNVLRLAAARMAKSEPVDGERGVVVLTASIAAFEGQIGQISYASSKAGVVGMTLVAARDLASRLIRVCSIAPGLFDTPILARIPEKARTALGALIPNPPRLGSPDEFAMLAEQIVMNPMLNGETIRLDGALRMPAR